VAVQKARTAAFFSDNRHAFSARGIGFVSQRFFPVGIDKGLFGPLFNLQNELSLRPGNFGPTLPNGQKNPLPNGITIFPGGAPLYKNGVLVGAVGVSGDGVDQDDLVADTGTKRFRPPLARRCDVIGQQTIVAFLRQRVGFFGSRFNITTTQLDDMQDRLDLGLEGVRLPYVKFPRNPNL
jgi:hypothetical protein